MDGVLEGAVVLCVCKLGCSLLFLPSLAATCSPVSFCCCCLLIFTDFLVTVFLSFLCLFESWLTDLIPPGDVIALRFLLFLSHTYGAVLLLTTFLIALETLIRLPWPHVAVCPRTESQTLGSDGQRCHSEGGNVQEVGDGCSSERDRSLPHVVGFLCCLSVWFIVALNVRWRLKMEEEWAAVCLLTTNSLVRCLPSIFSPTPVNLCWSIVAFLFLLVLLLAINTCLQRHCQAPAQMKRTSGCCWHKLSAPLKPVHPGMLVTEPAQHLEKSESSCTSCDTSSLNNMQMSACHHRNLLLIFPYCLFEEKGGQEPERTKRGLPLAFLTKEHVDSQHTGRCGWWLWGFPGLEENLIAGLVSVFLIFTLPFNLSVNILLIRTIDLLLDRCIKFFISSAAKTRQTSSSQVLTQV